MKTAKSGTAFTIYYIFWAAQTCFNWGKWKMKSAKLGAAFTIYYIFWAAQTCFNWGKWKMKSAKLGAVLTIYYIFEIAQTCFDWKEKQMKTAKLGAVCMISIIALAGVGAGYAARFDIATIDDIVDTGNVDLDGNSYPCTRDQATDSLYMLNIFAYLGQAEDGAVSVSRYIDLLTGRAPDPGDMVTYDVHFGTDPIPDSGEIVSQGQSVTSYDLSILDYLTTSFWKIVFWDNYGASTTGPTWDFTTKASGNNPPNTPNNPDLPNGATNVPLNIDLSWDGGDPDNGDTLTYDVYFGTANPAPKVVANQSATTYDPGILDYSTTYYWQIIASDEHGATSSGPTWDFTTEINNVPNTPSSSPPANRATNVPIVTDLSVTGGDPDDVTDSLDVSNSTTHFEETEEQGQIRDDIIEDEEVDFLDGPILASHYSEAEHFFEGHETMIKCGDTLYEPTERNLQKAIDSLNGQEGTVWLPRVCDITIKNNIIYMKENSRLRGAGATSNLELLKGIYVRNVNNVQLSDFQISGIADIKIISTKDVSGFVLENIEAEHLSHPSISAPPGLFGIWANDCTISDITFRNLKAIDIPNMMIHISGDGTTDKVKDVLIEDCYAKTCGRGLDRDWTTCYDLAEGITYIENMLVKNCYAEDAWENGFHFENQPIKKNVVVEDCTSVNNGWRKPSVSFGSGFWISGGITVKNCVSEGNKIRGYTFQNDKAGFNNYIIDCTDDGSTVGIKGEGTEADTYITNFKTKNNPDYGFYILLASNVHIDNMLVENSGGNGGSYNNLFGSTAYPVTDSELDVTIRDDPLNSITVMCQNGKNLEISGDIKTESDRALMFKTGDSILISDLHIDSTGGSAIHGNGVLNDVYIKNVLIENTERSPALEYGIYSRGTPFYVESSTVNLRGLADYRGCEFV